METAQHTIESSGFEHLHPVVQCTLIICACIGILGFYLALFTDFWDNISRKK